MKEWNYKYLAKMVYDNPDEFNGLYRIPWFLSWLRKNMHIFNEFYRYAKKLKYKGNRDYYSARAITQRLRWDTLFEENESQFKISDHSTPYMARLVMLIKPDLKGMFRIKYANIPESEE